MPFSEVKHWGFCYLLAADEEENIQVALNHACRLFVLGNYQEAQDAFAQEPLKSCTSAVIVLERSNMYERMGKERERAQILRNWLETAPKETREGLLSVRDLVLCECLEAEMTAFGAYEPAYEDSKACMTLLATKTIDGYSDVEVYCCLVCLRLVKRISDTSNWFDEEDGPGDLRPNLPSLTDIREALQKRNEYALVFSILRREANAIGGDDVHDPFQDVLQLYLPNRDQIATLNDETCYALAITNVFHAEYLTDQKKWDTAKIKLQEAMVIRDLLSQRSSCEAEEFSRIQLLHDRIEILLPPNEDLAAVLAKNLEIAYRARDFSEMPIARVHQRAAIDIANRMLTSSQGRPQERASVSATLMTILSKYLDFEATENVAIFRLSAISSFGFHYSIRRTQSPQDYLDMIVSFFVDFPDFSAPLAAANVIHAAENCARSLGKPELAKLFHESFQEIARHSSQYKRTKTNELLPRRDDDDSFFLEWRTDPEKGWSDSYTDACVRLILRWVKDDWNRGLLSPSRVVQLLRIPDDAGLPPKQSDLTLQDLPVESTLRERLFGTSVPEDLSSFYAWYSQLETWLRESRPGLKPTVRQRHAVLFQTLRCYSEFVATHSMELNLQDRARLLGQAIQVAVRCMDLVPTLCPDAVSETDNSTAKQSVANLTNILAVLDAAKEHGGLTDNMMVKARGLYEELEEEHAANDALWKLFMTRQSLASLKYRRWHQFSGLSPEHFIGDFHKAEETYNRLRLDHALLTGSSMVSANAFNSDRSHLWVMYRYAIRSAFQIWAKYVQQHPEKEKLDDPNNDDQRFWELGEDMIEWIQRSKARVMTGLLAKNHGIPDSILESLRETNADFARLSKEEEAIIEQFGTALPAEKIRLRGELDLIKDKLKSCDPMLEKSITLREGAPINCRELESLGQEMGPNVVFVEWVQSFQMACGALVFFYRNGRFRNISTVNGLQMYEVERWIKDFLNDEEVLSHSSATRDLRILAPLIVPILQNTVPGETLVLCPTGPLHRLPLHAIKFPGTNIPLVERNPVVYIQSLSLLRLCHVEQLQRKGSFEEPTGVIFNTLADPDNGTETTGRINEVITLLHLSNEDVTKESFFSYGSQCDIIHLHGHVCYEDLGYNPDEDRAGNRPELVHYIPFPTLPEGTERPATDDDGVVVSVQESVDATAAEMESLTTRAIPEIAENTSTKELNDATCTSEASQSRNLSSDQKVEELQVPVLPTANPPDDSLTPVPQSEEPSSTVPGDPARLTTTEILDMSLRRSCLVLAMGCNSSRAELSGSDDLLGLTTAFFAAGASSVIGTLWPVHREDCIDFSVAFYRNFLQQLHGDGDVIVDTMPAKVPGEEDEQIEQSATETKTWQPVVNLALALQQAVLTIGKDESTGLWKAPYHWAGFLLHGTWQFHGARRPLLDDEAEDGGDKEIEADGDEPTHQKDNEPLGEDDQSEEIAKDSISNSAPEGQNILGGDGDASLAHATDANPHPDTIRAVPE